MSTIVPSFSRPDTSHTIVHTMHKTADDYTLILQHPRYGDIGGCTLEPMTMALQDELISVFNLAVSPKYSWLVSDLHFDLNTEVMDKLSDPELKALMLDFYGSLYTVLERTSQAYDIPYYCVVTQTPQYWGAKQLGLLPLDYVEHRVQGHDDVTLSFLLMTEANSTVFYQHQHLERQAQQTPSRVVH